MSRSRLGKPRTCVWQRPDVPAALDRYERLGFDVSVCDGGDFLRLCQSRGRVLALVKSRKCGPGDDAGCRCTSMSPTLTRYIRSGAVQGSRAGSTSPPIPTTGCSKVPRSIQTAIFSATGHRFLDERPCMAADRANVGASLAHPLAHAIGGMTGRCVRGGSQARRRTADRAAASRYLRDDVGKSGSQVHGHTQASHVYRRSGSTGPMVVLAVRPSSVPVFRLSVAEGGGSLVADPLPHRDGAL
jgi:hypothetical protein